MSKTMAIVAVLCFYLTTIFFSVVGWFGLGVLTGCVGMCTRGDAWEYLWREMIWLAPAFAVIPTYLFFNRFGKKPV